MVLESLHNLLGGYLNEDWHDEYEDASTAIADFARSEPAHAFALSTDARSLLTQFGKGDDAALVACLTCQYGLGYLPSADGWGTYREWLLAVADRVDALLRGQASERAD